MAELFIEMVHENIHESVKQNYPAINFTKLPYEEIINHYFSYFDYSDEILSQRKPFQHRNLYEQVAIRKYADYLQGHFHGFPFDDSVEIAIELLKSKQISYYLRPTHSRIKTFHPRNREEFYE
ncbi:hypothetical protein M0804_013398 [Polistes exclamans]|nr:hypothetical protein M0804_013398 [Polistes exclamans]